ncbi:DEAD/DEAH box helicase [Dokdonella immobilis]|uniref:Helicase conserved C-terminal domain-containing protein n=1 Tax=Dokdonella immobilis TaxID=578942 RepID=A0A1I4ZRW5_9GAMM|nr:DEAD/DEAH box helicase [Dokdonella immobilis]SFN52730.1 Helicase conserved C-terminal domain-containing protein [Dokdonella immobilis]
MNDVSIHGLAQELRDTLIGYIEATYHISDADLLRQRTTSLESLGVIHQAPFLESTPRYLTELRFEQIAGLHPAALEALMVLATRNSHGKSVLFNPPYVHQADAIANGAVAGKNLVIMTGTGSGKTESFLMPVLCKLAAEARDRPNHFEMAAVRTMVLYPMNALVNDQLSRLRSMFGDPRIVSLFTSWAGRPARFARYTSRTPYAGIRTSKGDQRSLKSFGDFYVALAEKAAAGDGDSIALVTDLKTRGKWPAKPDVAAWYGAPGSRWTNAAGRPKRAVTLPADAELITRHEVQAAPADVIVTNYSMLEYMLMRPVERDIFEGTAAWLAASPLNRFTLILDEAHLYRGAAGTEVALLVRRLRDRLGIDNRQFQVICSTASFSSKEGAVAFTAQLTDTPPEQVHPVEGRLARREHARLGTPAEAHLLAGMDLSAFHHGNEQQKRAVVAPLLKLQGITGDGRTAGLLYRALASFGPLDQLVNLTMGYAQPTFELPSMVFPTDDVDVAVAGAATLALSSLASYAKDDDDGPSLLPARVHSFFRGLRGLWICMDPKCTGTSGTVAGRLYTQPRERCEACNAIVLELYTCRYCGTAYARGFSPEPAHPRMIWAEAGTRLRFEQETADPLFPVDLMLSRPLLEHVTPSTFDLLTGEIDFCRPTERTRTVYLAPAPQKSKKSDDEDDEPESISLPGRFSKCGACGESSRYAESPVQDHETKGDQPLQNLISRQLRLQPPSKEATELAPLGGRKVLVFSDSRQVAARLAPVLQDLASKDAVRACLAVGWQQLSAHYPRASLQQLYTATLIGAHMLGVRLRPAREEHRPFDIFDKVGALVRRGDHTSASGMANIMADVSGYDPPVALLAAIVEAIQHGLTGLEALAIGSLGPKRELLPEIEKLPDLAGAATSAAEKHALCVAWVREWRRYGFFLKEMPPEWTTTGAESDIKVRTRGAAFDRFVKLLPDTARKKFKSDWLPWLTKRLCFPSGKHFRLAGMQLSIDLGGEWARCDVCKVPQRRWAAVAVCLKCKSPQVAAFDPDTDEYFQRRKGFYRRPIMAALRGDLDASPLALIAAEHTAQLNAAEPEDVFSKGERNELLFQDVIVPSDDESGLPLPAVDVLSSTTTMEVGIDIGQLSGVALRNMPPSRANYQQRAGRAGRRANALASVIAFSGSDTHDEHFFTEPAEMISGRVVDPTLSLDNPEIAQRHLHAFLLQAYLQSKQLVPEAQLFAVLGTVGNFRSHGTPLNIHDLEAFLRGNEPALRARAEHIVPTDVEGEKRDRMLDGMIGTLIVALEKAFDDADDASPAADWIPDFGANADIPEEKEESRPPHPTADSKMLLDRLLYKGVLPRYAFPTDVATFHVFDNTESTSYRARLKYSPSQGMMAALSQYAPGKELWIDHKMYRSGAVYSAMRGERPKAWRAKRLYAECRRCGYSERWSVDGPVEIKQTLDCPACKGEETLGPVRYWFRPPGFAHRQNLEPGVRPDLIIPPSYATRAKLTLRSEEAEGWERVNPRVRVFPARDQLLITNTGPAHEGFEYCARCGLIEASHMPSGVMAANHLKPYPDPDDPYCPGAVAHCIVLGTDFYSDVALLSLSFGEQVRLPPGASVTGVALRTLAEALARAATESVLEIESGEIVAEYRPALTEGGVKGEEAELFLYDTLPGGAGYSRKVASLTPALLAAALQRLEGCAGNCDSSCYRCIRTFRNRPDHGQIDRHVGSALLRYLIDGHLTPFNASRVASAQELLVRDLQRSLDGWTFATEPGIAWIDAMRDSDTARIHIGHPLAVPDGFAHRLGPAGEELVLNELLVRRNLPQAARRVREFLRID